MANKKERPAIENPLANMGLDEIVRGITANEAPQEKTFGKNKGAKEAYIDRHEAIRRES